MTSSFPVYTADHHPLPLPPGHRFPIEKYELLKLVLLHEGILDPDQVCAAPVATRDELCAVHSASYVDAVFAGTVDPAVMRRIGFPWSSELVVRSCASVGGAIAAARSAFDHGVSGNLAGGTHHASAGSGEGFCVFNDHAVAACLLILERAVTRVAIIDLDVHQGNGTAAIIGGRKDVFLLSIHGERNYPFRKVPASLDIGLADGTGDDEYLDALEAALPRVEDFRPDLVLYQAGVDVLASDRLGRLALTHPGVAERDRVVLQWCRQRRIPVALAMGGGYAVPIGDTVRGHVGTYRVVRQVFG